MRKLFTILFLFICLPCYANTTEQAEKFFSKYITLSDTFDISVAKLYSDNAKIHTYRVYPHGLERAMELSGAQWKKLVINIMPLAKAKNDKSTFSNITIIKQGNNFKIKANRYSELKCYMDKGYYMVVEPDNNGNLLIIEEYMETQPQSNC